MKINRSFAWHIPAVKISRCALLAFVLGFACLGVSNTNADLVYAVTQRGGFGSIDLNTRAFTMINAGLGDSYTYSSNLAKDPATGQLYFTHMAYISDSWKTLLAPIGTDGVVGADVGPISAGATDYTPYGMAFSGAGGLYGLDIGLGVLGSVSTVDAAWNSVAGGYTLYSGNNGAMTGLNGSLYWADTLYDESPNSGLNFLYTINPLTGAAVNVGQMTGAGWVDTGLSGGYNALFANGDTLYALNTTNLFTVDQNTGAATLLGAINGLPEDVTGGFYGAAGTISGGPSPVPEPGTWAAAALLVGGAGFVRWRKRSKIS